jgi:hypothetical protein
MNIVNIRSPFKIVINESGQLFTQVKLYIWNKGDTEPTTPTYTLSKNIPDLVNRECVYNISNFLQEYVQPIVPTKVVYIDEEVNNVWCFFKVERYADEVLLDTTNYVGLNGFTEYMDGNQITIVNSIKLMEFNGISHEYPTANFGYFNLLLDTDVKTYEIEYDNGTETYTITYSEVGIILLKVPYTTNEINTNYPCRIRVRNNTDDYTEFEFNSTPIDECKYTPLECAFINSRGGWQFLTFFKAQLNSISVKGSEFNLLPNQTDYNTSRGQTKVFNLNGNQTIKCNTGWIDENKNFLFHDLMLSETILIDSKPAKLKTQSFTYKTQLKDKMINYEMEFEYAFDLINNVV